METVVKFIKVASKDEGISKKGEPWTSVLFIGETQEKYSKSIAFKIFNKQELIEKVFSLPENETITVKFDIESREFNGRWYTDVNVWSILDGSATTSSQNVTTTQKEEKSAPEAKKTAPASNQQEETDLPF